METAIRPSGVALRAIKGRPAFVEPDLFYVGGSTHATFLGLVFARKFFVVPDT